MSKHQNIRSETYVAKLALAAARVDRIRELAAQGYSQAMIGTLIGVSRERVRQICDRDGIETLNGQRDHDLSEKMRESAARGETLAEFVAASGAPWATVRSKSRREGITFAPTVFIWHQVRDNAAAGMTMTECAAAMGWSYQSVWTEARAHGITFTARDLHPAVRQSVVKGVSWNGKAQRWLATIRKGGKQVYLGSFVDEQDAIAARRAAERQPTPFSALTPSSGHTCPQPQPVGRGCVPHHQGA